ncbi:MAG: hypothetical protein ACXAC7_23815 [Candidatus Hodarchaeales archaeon]
MEDIYFTIVDESKLDLLIYDELIKFIPLDVADSLMIELGYNNNLHVYSLRNCAQIVRELTNGQFVISVQLCPNLPPYKDFFKNENVANWITKEQYYLSKLLYDEIFNQDIYKTLNFKIITKIE